MSTAIMMVRPVGGYSIRCTVPGCKWSATADDVDDAHCAGEVHVDEEHFGMKPVIQVGGNKN